MRSVAVHGPGPIDGSEWAGTRARRRHQGEEDADQADPATRPTPDSAAHDTLTGELAYAASRQEHVHDHRFAAASWTIGSGCAQRANKRGDRARLTGADMHRTCSNVGLMSAPGTLLANGRWQGAWPVLCQRRRHPAAA